MGVALIILPLPGGSVPGWLPGWTSGSLGAVPGSAIWLAVLLVGGWLLLHRTRFGVNLQALGGSEPSAWSAGIRVVRVRTLAYIFSGVFSALAGVVLAGLTQSGDPTIGAPYLLDTIAAVVIGGTSLVGGVGTMVGTVLGAPRTEPGVSGATGERALNVHPVLRLGRDRGRRSARADADVQAQGERIGEEPLTWPSMARGRRT